MAAANAGDSADVVDVREFPPSGKGDLRQHVERLQTILSTARDSIYLIEVDGTIIEINDAGAQRFGHSKEELIGRSIFEFVAPDLAAQRQAGRDRMLATGEAVTYVDERDGQWYESNVQPILDENGKISRISIFARDITERKRLEEQLAASHKMQALGNVAGGVAHEFNNLLQAIVGYLELLTVTLDESGEAHEIASTALRVAFGGQNLTQGLLSYVGMGRMDSSIVDLNTTLSDLSKTLPKMLGEKTSVRLSIDDELWPVLADASQLGAALLNLATNGRDAMRNGGTLEISAQNISLDEVSALAVANNINPGDFVKITVADTGDGMSEEIRQHVFDPFFTTKEPGSGTGLGLSMVYGFVHRQCGGFIEIDTEEGRGSAFSVYLPRWEGETEGIIGLDPVDSSDRFTILLVEDDDYVLESAKSNLERDGHEVLEASDGDQALKILEKDADIDVLVSDIVMPGRTSGIALAEKAKKSHPGIKVVLMTGYDEGEVAAHGPVPHDYVVLSKPFRMAELRSAIDNLLAPAA